MKKHNKEKDNQEVEGVTIKELNDVAETFGYSRDEYVELHSGHGTYRKIIQAEVAND